MLTNLNGGNPLFVSMLKILSMFVKLVFEPESEEDLNDLTERVYSIFSIADKKVYMYFRSFNFALVLIRLVLTVALVS